jgi:hypothetical protein
VQVIALVEWLRANPVIYLDVLKALITVGVVLGWWAMPGEPITDLVSAAGAIAWIALTLATRNRVTPAP